MTLPRRPAAGSRRRSWREVELASLDFETTGLDYARDEIVSFGVVPVVRGRIRLGASIHQLVAPAIPSSVVSMKVHGLLPRDLDGAPTLAAARDTLRSALDRRFVLAWYAGVERAFLRRTFGGRRATWRRRTIDVRDLAIAVEGASPEARFTLAGTAERYGVPVADPHDALDDALVAAQLFLVLASRLERGGAPSVRDLLRLSRRGA